MTTRKNPGLGAARRARVAASAADAASDETKAIKGIGIRMAGDLHDDLKDISHELGMSLNTLLVEGAKVMRDKYLQAARQAREEREKRRR